MPPTSSPKMPAKPTSTSTSTSSPHDSFFLTFFTPSSPSLNAILAYTNTELEYHHDYIQLLFPLPERSPFNPSAPIITQDIFNAFRSREDLREQFGRGFARMMAFYGFEYMKDGAKVVPIGSKDTDVDGEETPKRSGWGGAGGGSAFERRARKTWLMRFGHNHLRITRMLRSLRVLGCEELAEGFYEALKEAGGRYPGVVGPRSWGFWERAVKRELWLAPEDEEGEKVRGDVRWLWEWERGRKEALGKRNGEGGGGEEDGEWQGFSV